MPTARLGLRVGVLAVDPTSPFTGGALLGRPGQDAGSRDRLRRVHQVDGQPRAPRRAVAVAAPQALRILDAAGFDVICVETVGVGQAEVEIASLADSTLVIVAPGMGDSIQAAKAGILEIADIFVVNKSDRPGAQEVVRDLRTMLAMARLGEDGWKPPIVSAAAATGDGIEELVARLDEHWSWLGSSGERDRRRLARAREEVSAIAVAEMRRQLGGLPGQSRLDDLAARVAAGKLDPYSAADELLAG